MLLYGKILVELGEILEPASIQRKLGVEYSAPIDLVSKKWWRNGYFVYRLRRSYRNTKQTEDDSYISPVQVCDELIYQLSIRRKSGISYTGTMKLGVKVLENNGRFYTILVMTGG